MNESYNPKHLVFGDEGRASLINGITQISSAVKSTLGPMGNTVLIESPNHTHGITVTKDGVTVAKAVDLIDPVENLAVRMTREAADRTATLAGDGTTTAIVLTEALVRAGLKHIEGDTTSVLRDLTEETKLIVDRLKKESSPADGDKLEHVAAISSNNDPKLGSIIASVYKEVGKDGIVTVENSDSSETYFETTHGLKVDRGYLSPLFINNHKKDECVLEDVHILVSDAEITSILQIENVLKPIIAERKKLLLIAPCSTNVVNTLAANVLKNSLKLCAIQPPQFGYKQHELMGDIATSVGATYFSEKTGDDLSLISSSDLGHAAKVIVGRDSTVIVKGADAPDISERVSHLWDAHKIASKKADKDFVLSRIASLTGGIGVIYVGGNTDLEQKELYDRVDDAVCAVRSALLDGILPGGGLSLYDEHKRYLKKNRIADAILADALKAPLYQILENAGLDADEIYHSKMGKGKGYDVKGGDYGDMIEMGIIDPMRVTKTALENAVSVAVTILSTNAIITMARA
jgi:chaperonin GroEL